jgi:tetratricopeptide (TPR) repeat protein
MNRRKYAQDVISGIITEEEIDPILWQGDKPKVEFPAWSNLTRNIVRKYSKYYADRVVLDAQIRWYNAKNDYPEIARYFSKKVENYGLDTSGINWAVDNNLIYQVFLMNCKDKRRLRQAIGWERILVDAHRSDEALIDTYANLLYKVGDVKQAIKWEAKALAIAPADKDIQSAYTKMENGQQTW